MNTLAFLGPIGTPELIILGFIGLLIFGKRLPEVFKGVGTSIRTFKQGLAGVGDEIAQSVDKPPELVQDAQVDAGQQLGAVQVGVEADTNENVTA